MEPAIDSRYGKTDTVVLFELFTYLGAAPTELIADVDDLLDGCFGSASLGPALFARLLIFQELADTRSPDAAEPAVHRCSVFANHVTDLGYGSSQDRITSRHDNGIR